MVTLLPALLVIFGRWMFWPQAPDVPVGRAHLVRPLGPGRQLDRTRAAQGLGHHGRASWPSPASACSRCRRHGLSTEDSYTKEFDSIKGQQLLVEHDLVDNVQHRAGGREHRRHRRGRRRRSAGIDGLGEPTPPAELGNGRSYYRRRP